MHTTTAFAVTGPALASLFPQYICARDLCPLLLRGPGRRRIAKNGCARAPILRACAHDSSPLRFRSEAAADRRSRQEQHLLVRPRVRPQQAHLEWMHAVMREGRIDDEAQVLFNRYASAEAGAHLPSSIRQDRWR